MLKGKAEDESRTFGKSYRIHTKTT